MKKILLVVLISGLCFVGNQLFAQTDSMNNGMMKDTMANNTMNNDASKMPEDKSKRPSPPATATGTTQNGTNITIDYSQPSVKGRVIGKEVEPHKDSVWRTGANEATVFTVDKDVTINGKTLSAGKYGFFTIWKGNSWTLIFNKTWNQWGAFKYDKAQDVLRVTVKNMPPASPGEKMTFTIDNTGKVNLAWGNVGFDFAVK